MSDISIEFGLWELLVVFGWPGLIVGGLVGAFYWRRRRWIGSVLGAVIGLLLWAAGAIFVKLS